MDKITRTRSSILAAQIAETHLLRNTRMDGGLSEQAIAAELLRISRIYSRAAERLLKGKPQ